MLYLFPCFCYFPKLLEYLHLFRSHKKWEKPKSKMFCRNYDDMFSSIFIKYKVSFIDIIVSYILSQYWKRECGKIIVIYHNFARRRFAKTGFIICVTASIMLNLA